LPAEQASQEVIHTACSHDTIPAIAERRATQNAVPTPEAKNIAGSRDDPVPIVSNRGRKYTGPRRNAVTGSVICDTPLRQTFLHPLWFWREGTMSPGLGAELITGILRPSVQALATGFTGVSNIKPEDVSIELSFASGAAKQDRYRDELCNSGCKNHYWGIS